jgi:hypothetical protein
VWKASWTYCSSRGAWSWRTLNEVEGMTLEEKAKPGLRSQTMLDIEHSIGHRRNASITAFGTRRSDSPHCVIIPAVAVFRTNTIKETENMKMSSTATSNRLCMPCQTAFMGTIVRYPMPNQRKNPVAHHVPKRCDRSLLSETNAQASSARQPHDLEQI